MGQAEVLALTCGHTRTQEGHVKPSCASIGQVSGVMVPSGAEV